VSARGARSWFCLALICAQGLATLAGDTALAQPREDERARLLFLLPKLEASVRTQLREALEAQVSLVGAELLIEDDAPQAVQASLAERIESSQALAGREQADVVLWLAPGRGVWLLHVLDVGQDRMVVRRIDASQQSAAFEAIAVLTREASRAGPLAISAPSPDEVVAPAPADPPAQAVAPPVAAADPPPEPAAPAPRPPSLRLSLFYSGVDFAQETSFSHAAGLSARLDWQRGLFVGLHAGWAALSKPPGPLAIQRIPLGAVTGYRMALVPDLWVDLELGVVVDVLLRTTRATPTQDRTDDSERAAVAVAPRLRGEYRPSDFFGVFAGFGLDVGLSVVPYEVDAEPPQRVLTPNLVRPALEAGIAFYP